MKTYRTIISISILLLSLGGLQAQDIVTLPTFVTTASSVTGELQLNKGIGGIAVGDAGTFLDTPRSVSSIDSSTLEKFAIKNITQIQSYVSNVQTIGSFGQSSMVYIRGDLSEQYVNGQRRTNNAFGFQPSMNGVENIDLVHGAPSVVFGPGFYSGGYTNYELKQAQPKDFTNVNVLIGTLSASHSSFLNTTLQIDDNTYVNSDTYLRVSYEAKKDNTIFRRYGGRDDTQDLYVSLKKVFSHRTILDIYAEYSWQATPELIGVNRVTQELVWHNRYITGKTASPLDTSLMPNGKIVQLKPTDTLSSKGDFSNANVYFLQSVLISRLTQDITLKNYTMVEYVNRRRYNEYEYLEWAKQLTLDNRTELHIESPKTYSIIGLDERYEERNVEVGYMNTYFDAFDATIGNVRSAKSYVKDYISGYKGMTGTTGFFGPLDYEGDTSHSKLYSVSPFVQQRLHISDKLQLLYGVRTDAYRGFVNDPLNPKLADNITTYSVGNTESLIYSIRKNWTIFATIGRLRAVNGSVTGGAIVLDPNMKISANSFRSLNKLYEIGTRWNTETASVALTGFWQYRQQHNFYANQPDNIVARGAELEVKVSPTKSFFNITNLTYMESNFDKSFPFEYNGIGKLTACTSVGNYRVPGLSRLYLNDTIGYRLTKNVEMTASGRVQSEQDGDTLSNYHIPSQFDIDLGISYSTKSWKTALLVRNVTNELNWVHNGDAYGDNVIISRELPMNAALSFSYKF